MLKIVPNATHIDLRQRSRNRAQQIKKRRDSKV